ncbi:hypothetical protein ACGFIK_10305 [Micromonospora sp. NPDC048871]|uniref:hypothetical protein n=1 Tax=unclassified Micromonospora TaxID=2617518 RepID=UPI002E13B93B|nr:hypothetical protein OIE53_22340 [Micromonospora sp. NBC_01739]
MVNLSARRPHRSRIAYAFGILALLGAAATLAVLIRDPALSSTRLAEPVPAPEITVVEATPTEDFPPTWEEFTDEDFAVPPEGSANLPGGPESSAPHRAGRTGHTVGEHSADELSRSLFWSGVFGLAISLAGLGLVGTRRRQW